jgi:hypothetical protein
LEGVVIVSVTEAAIFGKARFAGKMSGGTVVGS